VRYGNGTKSFNDLIAEVQSRGICGRCGGCLSFCSASDLNALKFDKEGVPRFADEEKCLKCGICYLICPQTKALEDELKKKYHWTAPVGYFSSLGSARTTNSKVASEATDGGVVTSLLLYAIEKLHIDGAIVSHKIGPFSRVPAFAANEEEVISAAGSHFDDAPHLGQIGRTYSSFVPTIHEISKLKGRDIKRIAIVATPCQVYSLRKMQQLSVVPSDVIVFVIGLFCMENFSFGRTERKKIEKKLGVKLHDVVKVNIKEDVIMNTDRGTSIHVPFELIDEIARPACFACADFANDFADISCGGLGSADGYTTVMVRTDKGAEIYNAAKRSGFIEEQEFNTKDELIMHRNNLLADIRAFSTRKKERASKRLGASYA
jgi:coenzyme F420 hydrogenase subunit beta